LIQLSKSIVKIGQQYSDIQERRKIGNDVNLERFQSMKDQLRQTLSTFFQSIKQAQSPPEEKGQPIVVKTHTRGFSGDFGDFGSPPKDPIYEKTFPSDESSKDLNKDEALSTEIIKNYDEKEEAMQLDSLCQQANETASEIIKILGAPKFDSDYFTILLTLMGRTTKELAEFVGVENAKGLTDITKVLLRKGILLKNEPEIFIHFRNEVIHTLETLIHELESTTHAIEQQVDNLMEELLY